MTDITQDVTTYVETKLRESYALRARRSSDTSVAANTALADAASAIIRNAGLHARRALESGNMLSDNVDDAELVVTGYYRRAARNTLRDVMSAFRLVTIPRIVEKDHLDIMVIRGYIVDVDLLHMFGSSVFRQMTGALDYWWMHHELQGQADLMTMYRCKRRFAINTLQRVREIVESQRAAHVDELTELLLAERFNHVGSN